MATKVLADVNVCLDLLLDRHPHIQYSGRIFEMAEKSKIRLFISGLSFDTLFYIMRPAKGGKLAIEKLKLMHSYTHVAEIDSVVVKNALQSGWRDLEDALQFYSAIQSGCSHLVTRNPADFTDDSSQIQVLTPMDFCNNIKLYSC